MDHFGDPVSGYTILAELGRGTTGVVYKARQNALGRVVALKMPVLVSEDSRSAQYARFKLEAEVLASLTPDPNLPTLHEVGEFQGVLYHVREFIEGSTLEQLVAARSTEFLQVLNVLEQVARTVHRVHCREIVHRNLTASNILVAVDGPPKLIGFGMVRWLAGSALAPPGVPVVPAWVDLQALGQLLTSVCSGLRGRVPPGLQAFTSKCSAAGSAGGYASALALADDLAACPEESVE